MILCGEVNRLLQKKQQQCSLIYIKKLVQARIKKKKSKFYSSTQFNRV